MFPCSLVKHLEFERLNHLVDVCLTKKNLANLFSKVLVPYYIANGCV